MNLHGRLADDERPVTCQDVLEKKALRSMASENDRPFSLFKQAIVMT
jgi:hypothetical protein